MTNTITVETLFQNAIALEKATENLYRNFQNMFASKSQVAIFWKRYADEENGHAKFLERILSKIEPERLSQPTDTEIMDQLQASVKRALNIELNNIKTLEDAFNLAYEIETTETNAIFEFIFTYFSDEELAKSNAFLRTQLNKHVNKLTEEFPHEYRSSANRAAVPARQIPNSRFGALLLSLFPNTNWFNPSSN